MTADTTKSFEVTIEGYKVEMEHDGERWQCFVNYGRFSGSLACLSMEGYISDSNDRDHTPPAWVVGRIEAWAEQHGYND